MTRAEAIKAIEAGIETVIEAKNRGFQLIGTGETGMGNTTTSSAILSLYGACDIEEARRGHRMCSCLFCNRRGS